MNKILISNVGFGDAFPDAIASLKQVGLIQENLDRRRFTEERFLREISDADVLIAGTEKISSKVIDHAPRLKLISRVGVGIDNIDLDCAKSGEITIT